MRSVDRQLVGLEIPAHVVGSDMGGSLSGWKTVWITSVAYLWQGLKLCRML